MALSALISQTLNSDFSYSNMKFAHFWSFSLPWFYKPICPCIRTVCKLEHFVQCATYVQCSLVNRFRTTCVHAFWWQCFERLSSNCMWSNVGFVDRIASLLILLLVILLLLLLLPVVVVHVEHCGVCRACCTLPSIASRSVMGWPPFISAQYAPFCVSCFWSLNSTFRIFSYATCISHRSVFALNAHFLQLYFLYFHKYCLMHWVWHVCPFAPQRFHKLQTLTNTGELYTKLQFQLIICQQGWLPSSPPTTPGL